MDKNMDYEKLSGRDWCKLLKKNPEVANKCDWKKLTGFDWAYLLKDRPEFSDKCDWSLLEERNWCSLLQDNPEFLGKSPWEKLSTQTRIELLRKHPEFIDRCPVEKVGVTTENIFACLLHEHPEFAPKFFKALRDLKVFTGGSWVLLLSTPGIVDRFEIKGTKSVSSRKKNT